MDPSSIGLRISASLVTPLVKRLIRQAGPGAGLVDEQVRLSGLVSFHGEKRDLVEDDLRRLTGELVSRARRATGPREGFPDDEYTAVVDAVTRTLSGLGGLDMDDVQAVALGPEGFVRRLRLSTPDACQHLSADATWFHDRLVETAGVHILHFFTQRSTFLARTAVEQSRRLEQAMRLLEQLPSPDAADLAFETAYVESLVPLHGQVTIVGVDFVNSPGSWSLDATYVPLGAEPTGEEPFERRPGEALGDSATGSTGGPAAVGAAAGPPPTVPVDHALGGAPRILVRGTAGSGKTTLMQWLTVQTAADRLPESLRPLRGLVPFMLPVRRFSDQDMPSPADFLSASHHPMAGSEPDGWAVRVLRSGRALLLVDGIDEAPAGRRQRIREQIDLLRRTFPGNRWVVTTRPSAVREQWLTDQEFTEITLTPMNRDQVARFIRAWHRAAAGEAGTDTARLAEYERRLLNSVRLIRELRGLATNPLMCSLICALNRDRNGILPRGRKALYKAALAMLLERRDPEREVDADGIVIDREAKERLLQKLAHWMLLNDLTEMDRTTAVGTLERFLPAIPSAGSQGSAEALFEHLLHRTGLLRMPTPGSVDFVHRTFQDYLSAKEAVERHDFHFLVNNAHRSDWDEVIRMAVSLARPDECAQMMQDLVSTRPGLTAAQAKYCKLLASACLEHATEMSPETREMVRRRTRFIAQPDNLASARTLGWIGPIALELLPDPEKISDRKALLLAATASGVRDDAAIDYLARLRDRRSLAVRNELAAAWPRFDTERYAAEVIAHLDPEDLYFTVTSPEEMAELRRLGGRARIRVTELLPSEELLSGLVRSCLTHLYLFVHDTSSSLDWLAAFPHLTTLRLGPHAGLAQDLPEGIHVQRDAVREA
ncbi:NACHT domain-containing protein [Streptomyces sediminimaris]|uniref:NACHT domain-containing protein n=1 Tax=Streptomyces sediminimaris TaxID=3383721 RepID=UPI003999FA57